MRGARRLMTTAPNVPHVIPLVVGSQQASVIRLPAPRTAMRATVASDRPITCRDSVRNATARAGVGCRLPSATPSLRVTAAQTTHVRRAIHRRRETGRAMGATTRENWKRTMLRRTSRASAVSACSATPTEGSMTDRRLEITPFCGRPKWEGAAGYLIGPGFQLAIGVSDRT
jgi:hypothetical protein